MKPQITDPILAHQYFKAKVSFTTGPAELKHWLDDKEEINIVDVRRVEDYEKAHIPGAVNIPPEKWGSNEGLSKGKVNVLYCYTQQCHLAATAAAEFTKRGYPCLELEGGFDVWQEKGMPVQSLATSRH
jgi:rhodanese-related sulfurtransferase